MYVFGLHWGGHLSEVSQLSLRALIKHGRGQMELVKCNECIHRSNCPCGYSYCNAACLVIQKKIKITN